MRLNSVKSRNTIIYYVIKDYKKNGKWTTKVVEKIGTYEEIVMKSGSMEPLAWARAYVQDLREKEKEGELEHIAKHSSTRQLTKDEQRRYSGGYLFLQALFNRSVLHKIFNKLEVDSELECNLRDIICKQVVTRMLEPVSDSSFLEISNECFEKPEYTVCEVYKALQVIIQNSDFILAELYKYSKKTVQRNSKRLYYDCVGFLYSSDGDVMNFLCCVDCKSSSRYIRMASIFDADGFPLAVSLSNIGSNELQYQPFLTERIKKDFRQAIIVSFNDASYPCIQNKRDIDDHRSQSYINTQSLTCHQKDLCRWALDPMDWTHKNTSQLTNQTHTGLCADTVSVDLSYKSRWITENGYKQQQIIIHSDKLRKSIREIRIKHGRMGTIDLSEKGCCPDNKEAIMAEVLLDGYYFAHTNLDDDPSEIALIIERRWENILIFLNRKIEQNINTALINQNDYILAHLHLCLLTLFIYRLLEKKILPRIPGRFISGTDIIGTLRRMDFIESKGDGYIPLYTRTSITDALHDEFGFRTDYELIPVKVMNSIIRDTKNGV